MSFSYLFDPNKQFQDRNGVNNVGGFLRVYIDGTDDRATTYKDFNGTLNEADIMLDTDGRAVVIVDDSLTFRIEVYERGGALQWTVTQFTARGEGGGGGSSTPVVVDGTANEIDVTESMTAGVKYYTIGLATVVKNTLLGLIASFSNLVGILNSKADKVQGATAGNIAALDANGNITDSGSKVADFKTKQTPVADPSASGNGLEFIDSVSQNANGEITPHKKSVQDGTTAQKGVVQLQDSVGSTESATDKAVTPHAVRAAIDSSVASAYHAAGTKTVAQLTSSLLVAANQGDVYNITDSGTTTADFVEGAGHPINAGDNVGVCDVGGGVYKFDLLSGFVDLTNYLTKTGDASNTTSSLTKASGDTSTMTSGGKLSAIFTAISSFFASLKALAFKDKASYNDLSSGVQSSLDKADSALQSHQSVTDNNPTLDWGTTSKVGKVGSTDLHVTMPSNPASGKLDSTGDASNTTAIFTKASTRTNIASGEKLSVLFGKIAKWFGDLDTAAFKTLVTAWSGTTSNDNIPSEKLVKDSLNLKQDSLGISASGDMGKFLNERGVFATPNYPSVPSVINNLTSDSTTDALSAAQGKVLNETIADKPISEYGFGLSYNISGQYSLMVKLAPLSGQYKEIHYTLSLTQTNVGNDRLEGSLKIRLRNQGAGVYVAYASFIRFLWGSVLVSPRVYIDTSGYVYVYSYGVTAGWNGTQCQLTSVSTLDGTRVKIPDYVTFYKTSSPSASVPADQTYVTIDTIEDVTCAYGGVGNPTTPVYVDSNGQVKVCDPSQMSVGNATKWDGHAISIGSVSSSAGTISIV